MDKRTDMKKIKIVSDTPGRTRPGKNQDAKATANYWYNTFLRQSKGNNEWEDIKLVIGETEADYYLVVNHPYIPEKRGNLYEHNFDYYDSSKSVVMLIEPPEVVNRTWGKWEKPQDKDYLKVLSPAVNRMPAWWEIDVPYERLKNGPLFEKTKLMSAVLTGKTYHPGHKIRVEFFKRYLKTMEGFDLWGRPGPGWPNKWHDNPQKVKAKWGGCEVMGTFKNYHGELPVRNKNQGVLPYEYHFACENSKHKNYFTEKVIDPILADSLPFYWGCPNLHEFIPKESFIQLPLEGDMKRSYEIIQSTIKNNERKDRLPYIQKAKEIIIDELNLFPTLHKIINKHGK
jgi:hypothetical protein